jgi:hypothetical protein
MTTYHQVAKKSLYSNSTAFSTVIGTGCPGSASNMLYNPVGIFVDINFDLYVADCSNGRIQLFRLGETIASTVAGNEASENIPLKCPTYVMLDADKYLYIVDSNNDRIIVGGSSGFRCLVGCVGLFYPVSMRLYRPQRMAFDSYGNIFVTDFVSSRIQKFILSGNLCSKYDNMLLYRYNRSKILVFVK